MNYPGRIIGGTLVAIAVAWILNIAGVFPFNKSGTNQIDQTAIPDPNTQGTGGSQSITANNPANRPGTQNYAPGSNPSNGGTTSTNTTTPSTNDTANSNAQRTIRVRPPAVRAGW